MDGTYRPPVTDGSGQDRKVLKAAFDLLKSVGYTVQDGVMLDPEGKPFAFEILTSSQDEERLAAIYQRTLEKIGIEVGIRGLEGDQVRRTVVHQQHRRRGGRRGARAERAAARTRYDAGHAEPRETKADAG